MDEMERNQLPEVELYAIGAEEAEYAAALLSPEAVSMIQNAEAFGMALTEEGETRAAVCARLSPENETVLEIISLYVAPQFRRRGLGTTLVLELLERTMEATDASLRFMTVTFLADDEGMNGMLSMLGFEINRDESAVSWQISVGELGDSVLMQKPVAPPPSTALLPLEELSDYQIRQLVQTLRKHDIDMLSADEIRQAHRKASYVLTDERGDPTACAIFTVSETSRITLSQFFTGYKNAAPSMAVLQAGGKVLMEHFPHEALLEIPTLTQSTGKLVQRLLPNSRAVCLNRAVLDLTRPFDGYVTSEETEKGAVAL